MKVHYNIVAEQDLNDIAEYTVRAWSEDQRERYLKFLQTVCEKVLPTHHKQLATAYPPRAKQGVLRYRADDHYIIYFKLVPGGLEILHIRHVSRAPW